MPKYMRYRCAACGFGGKFLMNDDAEKNDCLQLTTDACVSIERHAAGRADHLKMLMRIDTIPGEYVITVNPKREWGFVSAAGQRR